MVNINTKIKEIRTLLKYFREGKIKTLEQHEVNPGFDLGSRENYLYFTLPVCINFQRQSPAMWKAALETWNDTETRFVFYPEKLAKKSVSLIRAALLKHKLALQPNKHVLIWTTIASTLHSHFKDDPREIIKLADNDILKLINILQFSYKKYFPYLSGPKLSNYWPFILSEFTDVKWKNPWEISIIPDTHVIKSTIKLGLVPRSATSAIVVEVWRDLLKDSGISPVEMHPVLWNWSRDNFQPKI